MKLSAQLYTVREFLKNEQEISESLKKVKKIGYDNVQLSGLGQHSPKNLKKILDGFDLKVCATHTPFDRIVNETDAVIDEHKLLEIKYVGLGWYGGKNIDDYKIMLDKLSSPVEKLYNAGLKFVYHNHAHEFIKYSGVRPLDYIRDNTNPEKFGFLPDFYWIQYAGLCPIHFLSQYKGRVEMVHLKDMRAAEEGENRIAEIFEGNMDYKSIIEACVKEGIEWAAVEQDTCPDDPFDSLKISLNNIKKRFPNLK